MERWGSGELRRLDFANVIIQGQRREISQLHQLRAAQREGRSQGTTLANEKKQKKTARRDVKLVADAKRFAKAMRSWELVELKPLLQEFGSKRDPARFTKADLLRLLKKHHRLKISTKRISQILRENKVEIR